jgi:hypothetical protein
MNQEEFYYLYININCLTDLGLGEIGKRIQAPSENLSAKTNKTNVDFNQYMHNAYSRQSALKAQAKDAFRRADLAELDLSVHEISTPLPPIQQKMNGHDMQQWAQQFSRCEDKVMSLVAEVSLLSVA